VKLNITNPQSDQGDGRGISIDSSCLNHGGGETNFRNKPDAIIVARARYVQHAEANHLR